jgi:hypothetical protein
MFDTPKTKIKQPEVRASLTRREKREKWMGEMNEPVPLPFYKHC